MNRWMRWRRHEPPATETPDDLEQAPEGLPDLPDSADLRLVVEAGVPEAARADLSRRLAAAQEVIRGALVLAGLQVRAVRVETAPAPLPDPSRPSTWADLLEEEDGEEPGPDTDLHPSSGLWRALDLLEVEEGSAEAAMLARWHRAALQARRADVWALSVDALAKKLDRAPLPRATAYFLGILRRQFQQNGIAPPMEH